MVSLRPNVSPRPNVRLHLKRIFHVKQAYAIDKLIKTYVRKVEKICKKYIQTMYNFAICDLSTVKLLKL